MAREIVCERSVADVAPRTVTEAYDVQRRLHASIGEIAARKVIGSKVGCTTEVMQEYLGIPHPCAGGIYDGALWATQQSHNHGLDVPYLPHRIERSTWAARLGVECEIAVRLSSPLGPGPVTFEEAASAVGSVHVAVELVEARYEDFERHKPGPLCLLADDFFHAGSVLGPPIHVYGSAHMSGADAGTPFDPRWAHLLQGTMSVDGNVVGTGSGTDIIRGHPLEALVWLASSVDAAPEGLPPGWIVSLGSVCRTHWLQPSESQVRVAFSLPQRRVTDLTWGEYREGVDVNDGRIVSGGRVAVDFV